MNLKERPPRSPRTRLGGYVILPRMLDKCRAELAGDNGDYHYNCPLDQHFLNFVDVDPEALKAEVAKGRGDSDILTWITENSKNHPSTPSIATWTQLHENRAPSSNDQREFFSSVVEGAGGAEREDIITWFDALDLDDHASYGGKA
ncbi:MAG: hypothetical protein ACI9UA_001328 [Pseudoalteromonas tetraodonis]|jgi:hypothetical protein